MVLVAGEAQGKAVLRFPHVLHQSGVKRWKLRQSSMILAKSTSIFRWCSRCFPYLSHAFHRFTGDSPATLELEVPRSLWRCWRLGRSFYQVDGCYTKYFTSAFGFFNWFQEIVVSHKLLMFVCHVPFLHDAPKFVRSVEACSSTSNQTVTSCWSPTGFIFHFPPFLLCAVEVTTGYITVITRVISCYIPTHGG